MSARWLGGGGIVSELSIWCRQVDRPGGAYQWKLRLVRQHPRTAASSNKVR